MLAAPPAGWRRTRQRRRARTNQRNPQPCLRRGSKRQCRSAVVERIHSMPLQQTNLDRRIARMVQDARALAQHFNRTCARATAAQDIGIQNAVRRTDCIVARDLAYKAWNVNVLWTSCRTRRVKEIQAAIRLCQRGTCAQRRMKIGELCMAQALHSSSRLYRPAMLKERMTMHDTCRQRWPASHASVVCANRPNYTIALARCSSRVSSALLWLSPFSDCTNIITIGTPARDTSAASCSGPDGNLCAVPTVCRTAQSTPHETGSVQYSRCATIPRCSAPRQ